MTHFSIRTTARGFTLVELLVVMMIVAILLPIGILLASSVLEKSRIGEAVTMLSEELDLARQLSELENREIEVRFYKVPDELDPTNSQFRAFQTVAHNVDPSVPSTLPTAGSPPTVLEVSSIRRLPSGVVFLEGSESTLLGSTSSIASLSVTLPDGTSGTAQGFRFRPSGMTDLGLYDEWTITLVDETDQFAAGTSLPPDFATIQIDPFTGTHRILRPN